MALTESTVPLSVRGLGQLVIARLSQEKVMLYGQYLTYLDVKRHYRNVMEPAKFADSIMQDKRKEKPDSEIISDLIRKLQG